MFSNISVLLLRTAQLCTLYSYNRTFFSHIQLLLLHISNCTIPRIFSRMQPFFSKTRGAFINNNWDFYLVFGLSSLFFKCHIIFAMLRYYIVHVNLCQKLVFLQNMGKTYCVQKLFWMSETISVHNMFSQGLSLEFSCIELVIQWTICCHILG